MPAPSTPFPGAANVASGHETETSDLTAPTTSSSIDAAQAGKTAQSKDAPRVLRYQTGPSSVLRFDEDADATEEALPILPKGIVNTTSGIYNEVAACDIIPPEKLREYWHVYTITHRKLYDPTANRLENFWWHVWGSSRARNLGGKAIAKLYEHIATGPTFVPLRTAPVRYDGPTIPNYVQPPLSVTTSCGPSAQERDKHNVHDAEAKQDINIKILSSSSSRPPPAQSILRKARPSLTGPRPSTRFDLPSEVSSVEDLQKIGGGNMERERDADVVNTGVAPANRAERSTMPNHADKEAKAAKAPLTSSEGSGGKTKPNKPDGHKSNQLKLAKKKFVVNSTASKRRILAAKRSGSHGSHGSQSSTSSDVPSTRGPSSSVPPGGSADSVLEEEEEEEDQEEQEKQQQRQKQKPQKQKKQQKQTRKLEGTIRLPDIVSEAASYSTPKFLTEEQQQTSHPTIQTQATIETIASTPSNDPHSFSQQEQAPSSISDLTAVSSVSESVASSASHYAAPGTVVRPVARGPRSLSFQQTLGKVDEAASHGDLQVRSSSLIERSATPKETQATRRPSQALMASLSRPGGRLIRQSSIPYDIERGYVPNAGSGSISRTILSTRTPGISSTSDEVCPIGAMAASAGTTPINIAPRMARSMSQESHQSPILEPMRSATVAAPSMVAVSGVLMEADGPDPFELYTRTGLEEPPDELTEREQLTFEVGSFGSSFKDSTATQRPFLAPTRPSQTPRIPFARTRSQLNVILDREKERLGEGNFASWQESRSGRDQDPQRN